MISYFNEMSNIVYYEPFISLIFNSQISTSAYDSTTSFVYYARYPSGVEKKWYHKKAKQLPDFTKKIQIPTTNVTDLSQNAFMSMHLKYMQIIPRKWYLNGLRFIERMSISSYNSTRWRFNVFCLFPICRIIKYLWSYLVSLWSLKQNSGTKNSITAKTEQH